MTKKEKRGFTLIELLVVVLIIGILAAVAVPQYQKAVEKSRVAEALTTVDTLKKAIDVYVLEHGLPTTGHMVLFTGTGDNGSGTKRGVLDIDIPGNCDNNPEYCYTKYHDYGADCRSTDCLIYARRWLDDEQNNGYTLELQWEPGKAESKTCFYDGEKAGQICNGLSGLGWEPEEL